MKTIRRIIISSGLVFLLLGVIAVLAYRFALSERATQEWVIHTYQVIGKANDVLADVLNAETGQRGFIITGQDISLAPYREGVKALNQDMEALAALTRDNPAQYQRVTQLRSLVDQRVALMEQGIANAQASRFAVGQRYNRAGNGRALMDQLRQVIAALLAEEQHLLAVRQQETRAAELSALVPTMLAGGSALVIFLVSTGLLARTNLLLEKSEGHRAHQAKVLQATLDNTREGIAVFDHEGHLCASNGAFFRLLGIPQLNAEKIKLAAIRAAVAAPANQIFDAIIDKRTEAQAASLYVMLDNRHIEIYRNSVPDIGFLIACADVTARVQAENIARQTQKMEAIGHLTGGIAHDFNNLLQVISANLDLLAPAVAGDDRAHQRLQNALYGVERGSRLTRQLLAFARRQPLEPRSINLGRLVQDITDILRRSLGEHIEIETLVSGGLWNTLADPLHVESAILNLAINARDAMPKGGKLTIELSNAFLDDAYARSHAEAAAGQYVLLAVSDTGMGMSSATMERAFEPFFSTKPEGEGTGLGLSQVYGFVKQSEGHIKLYSEPGEGTTVKVYLPRTRKPQELFDRSHLVPSQGGTESILVVEDDEGVRLAVVDMLQGLGYAVSNGANAQEALEVLRRPTKIDLLFTDVVMPGPLSTREFAQQAMALQPGLIVLYTSGYTQNAIVHNGRLDEGVALLSKPYGRDDLARKIRGMLDTRSPKDSVVPPTASAESLKRKVLVVEDEALIRMTTADMLEQLGYDCVEAGSGEEALERLDGGIDIIVTDLGLPGMSGHVFITQARTRMPQIKIVVASGYPRGHERTQGLPDDVVFLGKPYQMEELDAALT